MYYSVHITFYLAPVDWEIEQITYQPPVFLIRNI